ncbi:MAG: RNA-binding domain-containing protein [Vulcanimicrobiaceae bacterium]
MRGEPEDGEAARSLAALARGEGSRVEFKASLKGQLREAVCALANDLERSNEPGYLFVGIDDDGHAVGLTVDEEIIRELAQIRSDGSLQPLPSISVKRLDLDRSACAVVIIEPTDDPPMRHRGRIWVRVGSTTQVASAQDERRLIERRRPHNPSFDHNVAEGATIADIDVGLFEQEFLPAAFAPEVLENNGRTLDEKLLSLRFLAPSGVPTIGGILVLGYDPRAFVPGAYIQFVRFSGVDSYSPILDQRELSGVLSDVVRILLELLQLNVAVGLEIQAGGRDRSVPSYPLISLQEIAINALMHRAYDSSNAPTRVSFFSDRVEIVTPGGPFGMVDTANFGKPGFTDYRNPVLADALKVLGFAQRFGYGIAAANRAMRDNGNRPIQFEPSASAVQVTLWAKE